MLIPVGDFEPDVEGHPSLYGKGTSARNTLPLENGYDGPIKHPHAWTTTITGTVVGAFSADWPNLSAPAWFMGTATEIKKADSGGTVTDVTGAATISSATAWSFCQFGGVVVAADYANTPRAFSLSGGASFALISDAPKARYAATVEPGFVMLGNLDDGTVKPTSVRWSGINDHTSWPTVGTAAAAAAQSDEQQLPASGPITGIAPAVGGAAAAIFTERSIFRVEYVGPPSVFSFREVERQFGCVAPRSLVTVGGVAYFLSEQGFCAFDGAQTRLIGAGRVDRFFFKTAAPSLPATNINWDLIWGAVDPNRKVIIWAFPASGSTTPDRWLTYNYVSNRWRYAEAAQVSTDLVFQAGFGQYTTAAGIRSGCVVTWDHASNLPIAASLTTGYFGGEQEKRVFINRVRALSDIATYDTYLLHKTQPGATASITAGRGATGDGTCTIRLSARYAAVRVSFSSSRTWSYMMGFDVTARPEGRR